MGRRTSPLARTRRRSIWPAPQRCSCIQHGMGCRHDGGPSVHNGMGRRTSPLAHTRRRQSQPAPQRGPCTQRGMSRHYKAAHGYTTAWPSVIAARAHETALGMARSAEVLVHPRWHGPLARWCQPVSTRRHGSSVITARMHKAGRRSARPAPRRCSCVQHGMGCRHDGGPSVHNAMGRRTSPIARKRRRSARPAPQRCPCIQDGMGRRHDSVP